MVSAHIIHTLTIDFRPHFILNRPFQFCYTPLMAHMKAFDEAQTLEQVMTLFSEHGYEGTSIRDLTAHTGLSTSSLYATFGDKYELYGAALDKYRAIEREQFAIFLSVEQPLRPLLALMFAELIDGLLATDNLGSFTLNAAVEMGGRDTTIARRLRDHFDDISAMLAERLAAAQADGEIAATRSPIELARYLLFGVYTLALMTKFYTDRKQLNGTVEMLLAVLDTEPVAAQVGSVVGRAA